MFETLFLMNTIWILRSWILRNLTIGSDYNFQVQHIELDSVITIMFCYLRRMFTRSAYSRKATYYVQQRNIMHHVKGRNGTSIA